MKGKQLSVEKQIKYFFFYGGILWFAVGVLNLFDNKILKILTIVLSIMMIYFSTCLLLKKKEREDEMAETNLHSALSITFIMGAILIIIAYSVLEITHAFFKIEITLHSNDIIAISQMYLGFMFTLAAIIFRKLEEE